MKKVLSILLLFIAFNIQTEAQGIKWSAPAFRGLSFKEFADMARMLLNIRIFYREEWTEDIKMAEYPDNYSLKEVLDNIFSNTSVHYYFDKYGNVILTKDYQVRFPGTENQGDSITIQPPGYLQATENKTSDGNIAIEIGNPAERYRPGKAKISGYITNSDTREPVAGVTVFNQKLAAGAISNEFGFYAILLPRGLHTLQFSFIGMKEKSVNLNLYGDGELNLEMKSTLVPLKETVVSAQRSAILQRFEIGVEKINLTSFRLSPTALGEADIVKSVLLVPGVKSVGEGSQGFNVRGGSVDQNLILLYGAPVYSASHFFGFFSAVNPETIRDVTLYKGGIPGRFGGRISSVLDIGTVDGNSKEFRGSAGISPVTTQLRLEGPLINDTLSYILTARTTYSDWIFRLLKDPVLKRSSASFYDINFKITLDKSKTDKLEFASYLSHDSFRFGADSLYNYKNSILAVKWRHIFKPTFFSSFSLTNSSYKYEVSSHEYKPESFLLSHNINSTDLKADFNLFGEKNEINFGAEIIRYSVLPGNYLPADDSSLVTPDYIDKERLYEGAVYLEEKFRVTDYLSVNAGLRFSACFAAGPSEDYIYRPGFSKTPSNITDTLNFRRGEVSKMYGGPELRLSFNFRTSANNSLKINYNRTRQYLHLLTNTTSISPTDIWKLCDYNIRPQVGDQIGIGFYQVFPDNSLETSAEIYYKRIKNMVDFKGGANLLMNENIEQDIVNVEGKSYGLELLLKKTQGKLLFSIGYTFSRTYLKSLSYLKEEIINDGKWFPANFDKPGDLVITMNYLFSRRFSFSSNYTWSTGHPVTYPVATYNLYDDLFIHYSDRNKYRIPDYSRLDLAFNIAGSLKLHRIANPKWTFSVYNLLGRDNVYSVFFKREGDEIKGYQLSVFASAIPSVTFSFDF